jgi:hypothetical protein
VIDGLLASGQVQRFHVSQADNEALEQEDGEEHLQ